MRPRLLIPAFFLCSMAAPAQPLSFNFQQVTVEQGLSMSSTTAICEDKYGYIWLGTANGLNRYDGYGVKVYEYHFGDSTSLMPSAVRYLYCDPAGRLWISFMNGVMEYDYQRGCFREYGKGQLGWVNNLIEGEPQRLYIATADGLVQLNTTDGSLTRFEDPDLTSEIWDMVRYGDDLYLATRSGLVIFNCLTGKHRKIAPPAEMKELLLNRIAINSSGDVWLSGRKENDPVYHTTVRFDRWKKYTDLCKSATGQPNFINHLFFDRQDRIWVASTQNGIGLYDPAMDKFRTVRVEPRLPNGILSTSVSRIYQDRKGLIWAETPKGTCYFDPDNTFFQTILPDNTADTDDGAFRAIAVAERPDGRLWLGTEKGIFLFDRLTGHYEHYYNALNQPPVLYSNMIRSLCLDRQGTLWIGTTKGMNRLRAGSQKIEFLGEQDGLKLVNTFSIQETGDGTIWVGNFSTDGHCYLLPGESKFRSIKDHPTLSACAGLYGHCILEDHRGRLWFGLDGRGLIFFDPKTQEVRHWEHSLQNDTTLAGNYVHSLCEDAGGLIWAGTSMGLSAIDPNTFRFRTYDRMRGLPTNRVTAVRADRHNRLWIGTAQGLLLLDSTRQHVRQFDVHDGLPGIDFMPLPAGLLRDGHFVFPTRLGFVLFNPEEYSAKQPKLALLLSGVRVFNQPFDTKTNYENLTELYLPPGKNFFSLEVTALNYDNPRQTWYAYKMEPYDQDWTFSRERTANYTNVPGGNYTFHYKATTDPNNWNVPEKQLRIRVGEHWYWSGWFRGLMALLAAALGVTAYRRRLRSREAFLSLERKAQALSREKALVQYENLTQQLNPHFLFNSLASLGSLIRFDPKTASEFLEALSKMYRYILRSRERETVLLHEETTFVEHFLKLQKTRFGEALQVRFQVEAALRDRKIVPVTLQNLLENALKHNTFDVDDPLVVDIFTENDYLVVRNNLQRRPVVETSNKQGLSRLQSLYQYLSDVPMVVEENAAFFTVKVPLI